MSQAKVNNTAFDLTLRALLPHQVPELGVAAFAQDFAKYQVIDARSAEEFAVSHLLTAQHWPGEGSPLPLEKDRPVLVYCSIGVRSEKLAKELREQGFEAYNLYGGIFEWVNQEKPVFKQDQRTEQVHGYNRLWSIWLRRGEVVYEP